MTEADLKRPLVVNLFAGPGTGKSTTGAKVFAALKGRGVNAELAGEFAKDLTWSRRHDTLADQLYVLGKQHHRIFRLARDCDVIISDSPILMQLVYTPEFPSYYHSTVNWSFNRFRNLNFFLQRTKAYNPKGRNQTLEEAKQKDSEILALMRKWGLTYAVTGTEDADVDFIVESAIKNVAVD